MDDEAIRKLTGAAAFDQTLAGLNQMATVYGVLYTGLLISGIPEALARDMIRDQHRLQAYKAMWPDTPPAWSEE